MLSAANVEGIAVVIKEAGSKGLDYLQARWARNPSMDMVWTPEDANLSPSIREDCISAQCMNQRHAVVGVSGR